MTIEEQNLRLEQETAGYKKNLIRALAFIDELNIIDNEARRKLDVSVIQADPNETAEGKNARLRDESVRYLIKLTDALICIRKANRQDEFNKSRRRTYSVRQPEAPQAVIDPMSAEVQNEIVQIMETLKVKKGAETIVKDYINNCIKDKLPFSHKHYTGLTILLSENFLSQIPGDVVSVTQPNGVQCFASEETKKYINSGIIREMNRLVISPFFSQKAGEKPVFSGRTTLDYLLTIIGYVFEQIDKIPDAALYKSKILLIKNLFLTYCQNSPVNKLVKSNFSIFNDSHSNIVSKIKEHVTLKMVKLIAQTNLGEALEQLISEIESRIPQNEKQNFGYENYLKYLYTGYSLLSNDEKTKEKGRQFCATTTCLLSDKLYSDYSTHPQIAFQIYVMDAMNEVKSTGGFGMLSALKRNDGGEVLNFLTKCLDAYKQSIAVPANDHNRIKFIEVMVEYMQQSRHALCLLFSDMNQKKQLGKKK